MIAFNIRVPKNLGAKFPIVCLALWWGNVMCRYSKIWIICARRPCVEGDRDLPWNVLWQSKVLFFNVLNTKSSDTHLSILFSEWDPSLRTSYVIRQGRIRHGGAQWRMTYTSYVIRQGRIRHGGAQWRMTYTLYVIRHWEWRPWRMTYDVFWRMRQRIRLRREEADTADRGGYNMYTYVLAIL